MSAASALAESALTAANAPSATLVIFWFFKVTLGPCARWLRKEGAGEHVAGGATGGGPGDLTDRMEKNAAPWAHPDGVDWNSGRLVHGPGSSPPGGVQRRFHR